MELLKVLKQIGLTEKGAAVYLACLQLGVGSVVEIAKLSQLKRPTVYLILDDLGKAGLVSQTKKGEKNLFKAERPQKIITDLETKQELIREALPSLEAIYNLDVAKPNIKIGEGTEAVSRAYGSIFTYLSLHPEEELVIFGSLKDAMVSFEHEVVDFFHRAMAKSRNVVREIGNDDHQTRKYYRDSFRLNSRHDIKLIRNQGRFFQTDNMIYGNTLVVFSLGEQIFVTTIESANIAETYKTLFNLAWDSGKRI